MNQKITIPIEEYNALREAFNKASAIFKSLGIDGSKTTERITPIEPPKESKSQKVNKYKNLISSGERVKKPNYLKK